jgi:threonyl-tRNA synthetase
MLNVISWLLFVALVQVKDQLHSAGFMCDVDVDPGDTMNKKIRNAQLAQYNFILGELSLSCSL